MEGRLVWAKFKGTFSQGGLGSDNERLGESWTSNISRN